MKEIVYSTKAKKDLKRIQNNVRKIQELTYVLWKLAKGEKLDAKYQPHHLKGDYLGCLECHIEADLLLIWIDNDYIKIVRIGSHADLF